MPRPMRLKRAIDAEKKQKGSGTREPLKIVENAEIPALPI